MPTHIPLVLGAASQTFGVSVDTKHSLSYERMDADPWNIGRPFQFPKFSYQLRFSAGWIYAGILPRQLPSILGSV
ncbi:hypothetical protein PILCRDRAFT_3388 [Piloderma croceum F 1598]|uniref:Uncharacterized protein n=1 Tax=Piloderma croceum (strain F 1598) TaxID=765440 RepID=A0A0C3FVC5_PILCF|nr:hypothetical protein PILCRDRAFT_3388 [Piloderma croceum F 1598]